MAGELGVLGLVGEVPEFTLMIDAAQEVGVTSPCRSITLLVEERPLEDDLWTSSKLLQGLFDLPRQSGSGVDLGDITTACLQLRQVPSLMLEPAALHNLEVCVIVGGLCQ
jgi:hypothetical protein